MRFSLFVAVLWLATTLAIVRAETAGPVAPLLADPEDGEVRDGVYTNAYFGLSFPLPVGWRRGLRGPPPSLSGTYDLVSFDPPDDVHATLRLGAQDLFFAPRPIAGARAMADALATTVKTTQGMALDRAPEPLTIANLAFWRLDYSGAGLSSSLLATERRCHVLDIAVTTTDPALRDALVEEIAARLSLDRSDVPEGATLPLCRRDYVGPETLLERSETTTAHAATGTRLPVRLVIAGDGTIAHVHVIAGAPEMRRRLEAALAQWRFRPLAPNGGAIETGLFLAPD